MYFTSNHDENSWNGTEMERMGDARFVMAVLSYAMNGMTLIYNGQETSLNRRLLFFEKDQITWDKMDMVSFYFTLNALKHRDYLLSADRCEAYEKIELLSGGKVIAISRLSNSFPGAELVFYLNLSSEKQTVTGPSDSQAKWTNVFTGKRIKQVNEPFKLAPWGYMVIEK